MTHTHARTHALTLNRPTLSYIFEGEGMDRIAPNLAGMVRVRVRFRVRARSGLRLGSGFGIL